MLYKYSSVSSSQTPVRQALVLYPLGDDTTETKRGATGHRWSQGW